MKKLLDFYAEWCGPCKQMKSVIKELEDKYIVEKIDVDKEGEKASQYGIQSIPTFIIIKDEKEVSRIVGSTTKEEIERQLRD